MPLSRKHIALYLPVVYASIWLLVFFIVPLIIVFIYSFFQRSMYGGIDNNLTLSNYVEAFSLLYIQAFLRTIGIAVVNVLLCFIVSYPVAYFIAFKVSFKTQRLLLLAITLPFFSNYLARIYSWLFLLSDQGVIGSLLTAGGWTGKLDIIFTPFSVIIGLLYNYFPFMLITNFLSLQKIDRAFVLSARDLGASPQMAFFKIIFPLSLPGIVNGAILVFVLSIADYVIPTILGGSKYLLISNVIASQFFLSRNLPMGAALTTLFIIIIIVLLVVQQIVLKKIQQWEN